MNNFISRFLAAVALLAASVSSQDLFAGSQGGAVGSGPVEVGPTVLEWEGQLVPQDFSRPLFNDFGYVIRGNATNGEEFTLWLFVYRQIGEEEFIQPEDLFQLSLIHGNFTDKEKASMQDTPFVNIGQDIEDYSPIGTLKSTQNSTHVEYSFKGFTLGSTDNPDQKKTWSAKGTWGGVTVDIQMHQNGEEVFQAGSESSIKNCDPLSAATNYNCTGNFGGIAHFKNVTGTMKFNGTTLTVDTAYGVHERLIQAGSVPSRILNCLGTGATWIHGWGERLDNWVFNVDFGPLTQSLVNIDDTSVSNTGIANTSMYETGHWIDPKSNQLIPSSWHVFSNNENGRMDSYVTAFGRLYYYWMRKGGMIITYQYIADAETSFTYPNGTVVSEHQVAFIEYFRTIYISTPNPNTQANATVEA